MIYFLIWLSGFILLSLAYFIYIVLKIGSNKGPTYSLGYWSEELGEALLCCFGWPIIMPIILGILIGNFLLEISLILLEFVLLKLTGKKAMDGLF